MIVDLAGVEPASKQLILGHAKISYVNVVMISQNIRFKAIFRLSDAFLVPSPVATLLKVLKLVKSPYFRP